MLAPCGGSRPTLSLRPRADSQSVLQLLRFALFVEDLNRLDPRLCSAGSSAKTLAAIRKRGGQYLVGTPRSQMKR
jgi:hypothetical protein